VSAKGYRVTQLHEWASRACKGRSRVGDALFRLLVFILGCCFMSCQGRAADLTVELDYWPFQEAYSTSVNIATDGSLEIVTYSPQRLAVVKIARGTPPTASNAADLMVRFLDSAAPAIRQDESIRHGDRCRLRTWRGGKRLRQWSGFMEDAPPAIQREIRGLLGWRDSLHESRADSYFLRFESLESYQLKRLRDLGRYPLYKLQDLPDFVSSFFSVAGSGPRAFRPIDHDQYTALLKAAKFSRLVYVTRNENSEVEGFEISLYLRAEQLH